MGKEEVGEQISEWLSKLKPIKCMAFQCEYAYPDEYNRPECDQNLKGYIRSWTGKQDILLCPYYKEKDCN